MCWKRALLAAILLVGALCGLSGCVAASLNLQPQTLPHEVESLSSLPNEDAFATACEVDAKELGNAVFWLAFVCGFLMLVGTR